MEHYIPISYLNDFLYCPESIYLHGIYQDFDHSLYQSHFQVNGKIHHTNVDHSNYSTSSNILQGTSVYSSKYKLFGKIDLFEIDEGRLIERKARISKVFLGHKYQLYAQMFGLNEAGFEVKTLAVHSLEDNKTHSVDMPSMQELADFGALIKQILTYNPLDILSKGKMNQKAVDSIYGHLSF